MRTAARTFSFVTRVPAGSSTRAMTTSSSGCRRMVRSAACSMALPLQRMARHQLVGMHPAGQGLDALQPRADARKVGPRYAEFLGPVQVAAQREVGNRGLSPRHEILRGQVLVENAERGPHPAAQEFGHRGLAGFLELDEESQGGDVAG